MTYGIGKVNTTRVQTKNFCGEGVFDPKKVYMRPDVNGKVLVNDILCKIVRFSEEAQFGSVEIAGKVYKTVKIGNLTWLAENLDYVPDTAEILTANSQSSEGRPCVCYQAYDSTSPNGLLYNALAIRLINIPGWRMPIYQEFQYLTTLVGGAAQGYKLCSTTGWSGNGTDEFGFCAVQNGYRNSSFIAGQDMGSAYFSFLNKDGTFGRWAISQTGNISYTNNVSLPMYSVRLVAEL